MLVVAEYLKLRGIPFDVMEHPRAFTSISEAESLGVPAEEVLKTVVLDRESGHAVAVIPANRRLDMRLVREAVGDPHARLADERELEHDFTGYDLGAMPPLGSLIGARTYIDPEVFVHEFVEFAAGSQTHSIRVRTADLFRREEVTVTTLTEAMEREKEPVG